MTCSFGPHSASQTWTAWSCHATPPPTEEEEDEETEELEVGRIEADEILIEACLEFIRGGGVPHTPDDS